MPDDDTPKNPFVRWKHHVDSSIGFTLNGLLGIPTMVTQSFGPRRPDDTRSGSSDSRVPRGHGSDPDEAAAYVVDEEQAAAFTDFLASSPYSPLNLRHLPQPVPRGVPHGVDPAGFTFSDAFEDLLAAGSGRPLTDLAATYYLNTGMRSLQLDKAGELAFDWWFRRLQSGRNGYLVNAYFPHGVRWHADEDEHNRTRGESSEHTVQDPWRQAVAKAHEQKAAAASSQTGSPGGLFDELERVLKVLGRITEEDIFGNARIGGSAAPRDGDRRADTEDELYSAVRSAFVESGQSLSAFVKAIADAKVSGEVHSSVSTAKSTSPRAVEADEDEARTVRTSKEHVDMFGNRHVKTVVRKLDAEGNEVARETHYTIRSDSQPKRVERDDGNEGDEAGEHELRRYSGHGERDGGTLDAKKKTGWFWK